MIKTIFEYSARIKNGRTKRTVLEALFEEAGELEDEVAFEEFGHFPGEDGIVGESVDVILCAVDMIYQDRPDITEDEIMTIVKRKLDKWERKYGKAE